MNRIIRGIGVVLLCAGAAFGIIACTRITEGVRHSPALTLTIVAAGTFVASGFVVIVGSWLAILIERATKQRAFVDALLGERNNGSADTGDTGELLLMAGRSRNGRGATN